MYQQIRHKCIKIPVHINCPQSNVINDDFTLIIPYDHKYKYTLSELTADIMDKLQQMHKGSKLIPSKVAANSFTGHEVHIYNGYDWDNPPCIITNYEPEIIADKGITLTVNLHGHHERILCVTVPVTIKCPRDTRFCDDFLLIVPYDHDHAYSIDSFASDITNKFNQKHTKYRFIPSKIQSESFVGKEIIYDNGWEDIVPLMTDYKKKVIQEKGMKLEIDLDVYRHRVRTLEQKCTKMKGENDLCPIYAKMRYQDIFNEQDLNHLYDYEHDTLIVNMVINVMRLNVSLKEKMSSRIDVML